MRLGYPAGRAGLRHSLSSAPLTHAAWCVRLRVALPDAPGSDTLSLSALGAAARGNLIRHVRSFHDKICLCVQNGPTTDTTDRHRPAARHTRSEAVEWSRLALRTISPGFAHRSTQPAAVLGYKVAAATPRLPQCRQRAPNSRLSTRLRPRPSLPPQPPAGGSLEGVRHNKAEEYYNTETRVMQWTVCARALLQARRGPRLPVLPENTKAIAGRPHRSPTATRAGGPGPCTLNAARLLSSRRGALCVEKCT